MKVDQMQDSCKIGNPSFFLTKEYRVLNFLKNDEKIG